MRKLKYLLLFSFVLVSMQMHAALIPSVSAPPANHAFTVVNPKQIEKFTGKKLTFVQKLALKLYGRKLEKLAAKKKARNSESMGTTSMLLGIGSIVLLALAITGVPFVLLASLLAAVAAIVLGSVSQKGGQNAKGIVGIVTGGVTILLMILALIIVIAAFSGFMFE